MKDRRQRGLPAVDLMEEAVHLLRGASAAAFAWYFLGALPFILALLYFWSDMSWSVDARADCAVDALFVALAFVWMKFCQAKFARKLAAQLKLEAESTTWRGHVRMFLQQAIIQPSKFFLLPVALVITLPFGWLWAFYENVTAFGEAKNLRALASRSQREARLWPAQNHLCLAVLILLGCLMFANLLIIVLTLPYLARMFSGFENVFTRSGIHVFNSTILAVAASLAYLCCDPLVKAVYVLRCFYGESLQSGEDLQVELRRLRAAPAIAAALILFFTGSSIFAATANPPAPSSPVVNATELDRSISETIAKPEFSWRMPREETAEEKAKPPNAFDRFLRQTGRTFKKAWRAMIDWVESILPKQAPSMPDEKSAGSGVMSREVLEVSLVILCAALVVLLAIKIRDRIRQTRTIPVVVSAPKPIDLTQESVTADQLPEDEWLRLARDMMANGEWRLALRALFLAGLAHLSQRGVIALARHKSNRDYQLELRRRAPAKPELQTAFSENLREVERAWYGRHEVDPAIVENFQSNLATIRAI